MDMVHGREMEPHRGRLLNRPDSSGWIAALIGGQPADPQLFETALTHGSTGSATNYERLEFLGDRVLGLMIAEWLFERFPAEPEGALSRRINAAVSRESCAEVARAIALPPHLRLGKQARDDGASDSDNVLGDVVEALLGALYLDRGLDAARDFVRAQWNDIIAREASAPRHPKSALQEWAAANKRRPPAYSITDRSGPPHNPRFTVLVSIAGVGEASAEGSSKQEAETAAARALLAKLP